MPLKAVGAWVGDLAVGDWGGDGVSTLGGLGDDGTFSFAACNLARKLSLQNNRNEWNC